MKAFHVNEFALRYLEFLKRHQPTHASWMGLREVDPYLPRLDEEGIKAYLEELKELAELSDALSEDPISETARREVKAEEILSRWELWKHYPLAPSVASSAIIELMIYDLPKEYRDLMIRERIKKMPKMFEENLEILEEPYSVWVTIAKMEAEGLKKLLEAYKVSANFIDKYLEEIDKMNIKDGFKPMGEDLFDQYMRMLLIDWKEHLAWSRKELERLLPEFQAIKCEEKPVEDMFEAYEKALSEARRIVVEQDLVTLPPGEKVKIAETPDALKPLIPFAAFFPSPPLTWDATGILIVTPETKEGWWEVFNTAVHEAYPGHHVQLATKPSSLALRVFGNATDFIEGWAHYTEQLIHDLGILKHPCYDKAYLRGVVWRLIRVEVDVGLSTGKMNFEEAVSHLTKVMGEEQAKAEVNRYTLNPGYNVAYSYGKRKILEIRDMLNTSLKNFHDWLLSHYGMPLGIVERIAKSM